MEDLNKIPLFNGIEDMELKGMIACINPRIVNYKKDEFIVMAGDELTGVGVILQGQVAILKENINGDRMIMAVLNEGSMFGEVAAFSKKKNWPSSVYVKKDCKIMFIPPEKIVTQCPRACSSHRDLIVNMLKILSDKALSLNKKVEYLAMKTLREKISNYLLEQYKKNNNLSFKIPLSRNALAEFLNVSRPSLSREMGNMRDEGIITFDKANITIKDLQSIADAVE